MNRLRISSLEKIASIHEFFGNKPKLWL